MKNKIIKDHALIITLFSTVIILLTQNSCVLTQTPAQVPAQGQAQTPVQTSDTTQNTAQASVPAQATVQAPAQPPVQIPQKNLASIQIPISAVAGKQNIPIGATLPLKGEASILGNQIFDGLTLYLNQIRKDKNAQFFLSLSAIDDGMEITKIRENTKALTSKSPILISPFGTDTLLAIKDPLLQQEMTVFFPIDGSVLFRTSQYPSVVFFRPSFEKEIEALAHYSIVYLHKKKCAVFYEASEWGEECLATTQKVLNKYKIKIIAQAAYPQKTVNISNAANTITRAAPNAIFCFALTKPAYNFIAHVVNKGLPKTAFLGPSFLFGIQKTLQKSRGVSVIVSSVVPDPKHSKLEIVKEYRDNMKKFFANKELSPFSLEGYINAAILHICLTGCFANLPAPYTAQNLLDTVAGLKEFNFKGLKLNYNPQTRTLSQNIWLNTGDHKKEWSMAKRKIPV
jgi:ABC-type branched-subunit amino acid transport system substrate-binding protein